MSTRTVYEGFEACAAQETSALYRLCLLLTRRREVARERAFDALLRLAARDEKDPRSDQILLLGAAVRLCEDWELRQMRRAPSRRERQNLVRALSLPEEGWESACRLPFAARAALALTSAGLSPEDIGQIAGKRAQGAAKSLPPEALHASEAIVLSPEEAQLLCDRVYDRFSERDVRLENQLHALHARFERAAPLLALCVLALFALALWVTR